MKTVFILLIVFPLFASAQNAYDKDTRFRLDSLNYLKLKAFEQQLADSQTTQVKILDAPLLRKILTLGFGILTTHYPTSDYSTGFEITAVNGSKTAIKYIWATLSAYDAANGLIGSKTIKITSPLAYSEKGAFRVDNIFFTDIFYRGELVKIRIQYANDAIKEFIGASLSQLFID